MDESAFNKYLMFNRHHAKRSSIMLSRLRQALGRPAVTPFEDPELRSYPTSYHIPAPASSTSTSTPIPLEDGSFYHPMPPMAMALTSEPELSPHPERISEEQRRKGSFRRRLVGLEEERLMKCYFNAVACF